MKLWSIQNYEVYERYLREGRIVYYGGESDCYEDDTFNMTFREGYEFMAEQMVLRGIEKPEGLKYPVWAWYQYYGVRKKRDIRQRQIAKKGEKYVQLYLDIPSKFVLLSDFESWHGVLNHCYMYLTDEEENEIESIPYTERGEEYYAAMRKSWEVVFDIWGFPEGNGWTGKLKDRCIQACVWQILPEHILKVQPFIAR